MFGELPIQKELAKKFGEWIDLAINATIVSKLGWL